MTISNNSFEGQIFDLSSLGAGLVKHPLGRIFFVPGTWPGDIGLFEVTKEKKNYGEAKLLKLLSPSPQRRKPPCPHQGLSEEKCGACPWMIVPYHEQLQAKNRLFKNEISRSGLAIDFQLVKETWPALSEWGGRNRAQFKTDGKKIGFVSAKSKVLAPINECQVLNSKMQEILSDLINMLPNPHWRPTPPYLWNFLDVDDEISLDQLVINSHRPFKQANSHQNEKMKTWLSEKLKNLPKNWSLLELFCGAGNFTQEFSKLNFHKILACDFQSESLKILRSKKLKATEVVDLDLFSPMAFKTLKKQMPKCEIVVLDPPREGLMNRDIFFQEFKNIQVVIYISCHSSTFIRDIKDFYQQGFKLQEIQPLDQFPQTPHLEILSLLIKTSQKY